MYYHIAFVSNQVQDLAAVDLILLKHYFEDTAKRKKNSLVEFSGGDHWVKLVVEDTTKLKPLISALMKHSSKELLAFDPTLKARCYWGVLWGSDFRYEPSESCTETPHFLDAFIEAKIGKPVKPILDNIAAIDASKQQMAG